ncbi:type II secretion system protein [Candidatus Collierbacteria bacterium]|nr:type II secretion system protein [Candidatus Collierbacteria bacterium]
MRKNGFTLLELLVVVGIIAILVSLVSVAYNTAQKRARDARRRGDMNAMKNALEQYYSANSFVYPTTCSTASTYITGAWPADPGSYTYTQTCAAASYCICAQLETGSGGNSSSSACGWASNGAYYCVANLQ